MAPTIQVLNSDFGLTIQALFMNRLFINSVLFKGLLDISRSSKNQSKECDAHFGPRRFTMGLLTALERSLPRGESGPAAARLAPLEGATLEAARTRLEADGMGAAAGPSAPPPERTSQPPFPSHAADSDGARARFARTASAQVGGG